MDDEEIDKLLREVGMELPDVEDDAPPSDSLAQWNDDDLERWD